MTRLPFAHNCIATGLAVALGLGAVGCGKEQAQPDAAVGTTPTAVTQSEIPAATVLTVDAAILPGADLVMVADLGALRTSTMYERLQALSEKNQLDKSSPDLGKVKQFTDELSEMTGLTKDDIEVLKLSAKLGSIDFSAEEAPDLSRVNIVMGAGLTKPLALAAVETAIRKAAANEGKEASLTRDTYRGTPVLVAKDLSSDDPAMYMAMGKDDKVLLAGSETGLKGALDNAAAGTPVAARDMPGGQIAVRFGLPESLKTKLQAEVEAKQAEKPDSVEANLMEAMKGLQSVSLGIDIADRMDVSLMAKVGSDEDAAQVKTIVDGTVLGMAQFVLTMMTGGKPMPLSQSLKTAAVPGGTVKLTLSLTEEDLNVLEEAAKKRAAGAPTGMPPMPPGIPPPPPPAAE